MDSVEPILKRSLEQYQDLLAMTLALEELLLRGDARQVQDYLGRLDQARSRQQQTDSELMGMLAADVLQSPLFRQRIEIMGQINDLHQTLLPKVQGMQAVAGAELDQLKGGRAAVSGYHATARQPAGGYRGIG